MYPTLSDLIFDLTGLSIPMGIQMFGLMMAVAFLVAGHFVKLEFARKMKDGLVPIRKLETKPNTVPTPKDIALYAFAGFVAGFKLVFILFNYSSCAANPQETLFSLDGNWLGGIVGAALFGYLKYKEGKPKADKKPEELLVTPSMHAGNVVMICAISGILGAKVFDFMENPSTLEEILEDPAAHLFSGLTMYGGLIFAIVAVYFYGKKNGISFPVIADITSPAAMIGYAVGRIGCHTAGDGDWGIDNLSEKPGFLSFLPDWAWAYQYPHNVNNEGIPIPGCEGNHCFMLENPVFPTPLYEVMMCSVLFFVLWSFRKKIQVPGMLFALYLMLNGVERFTIEKIRVNISYDVFGMQLTQAEMISTGLFFGGMVLWFYLRRTKTAVDA